MKKKGGEVGKQRETVLQHQGQRRKGDAPGVGADPQR